MAGGLRLREKGKNLRSIKSSKNWGPLAMQRPANHLARDSEGSEFPTNHQDLRLEDPRAMLSYVTVRQRDIPCSARLSPTFHCRVLIDKVESGVSKSFSPD